MKLSLTNFKATNGALSADKISQIKLISGAHTFIETGTYLGDTVCAMREIFERVYSIELADELYQQALERFADDDGVTLLLGESSEKLHEAAKLAADRGAIFWLDAHWSGGNTARAIENTPIIRELKSIQSHQLDNSIVMIDDLRYFINIPKGFEVHEANYGYPLLRELLGQIRILWPRHISVINGDILFIFPQHIYENMELSSVLLATNDIRLDQSDQSRQRSLEAIIASAEGDERETILSFPNTFRHSLNYGIGGDYLYWSALIYENDGAFELARANFELARRCGVNVPTRHWE